MLVDGRHHSVGQPAARVGGKLERIGLVAVLQHDICRTLVVQRSEAGVTNLQVNLHLAAGSHVVAVRTAHELVAVTHTAVQFVKRAVAAPHVRGRLGITALDERPVQTAHLAYGLVVGRPLLGFVHIGDVRLTAYRHVQRLLCQPGFLLGGVGIGAHVVVVVQERIVVLSESCTRCAGERLFGCQRLGVAHITRLEQRRTQLDHPVGRYGVQQGVHHRLAAVVHLVLFVAEVIRVVPLAPSTYYTCLKAEDHIGIGLPVTLVLVDMLLHYIQRGILGGLHTAAGVRAVGVRETDDSFQAFLTQHLHILVKGVKHLVGDSLLGAVVTQVVVHQHDADLVLLLVVVQVTLLALDAIRVALRQVAADHRDESAFGIREDRRVVGCVRNSGGTDCHCHTYHHTG